VWSPFRATIVPCLLKLLETVTRESHNQIHDKRSKAFLRGSGRQREVHGSSQPSTRVLSAPTHVGLRKRRTAGEAKAAIAGPFEHYKFDGEESSMHLEWRARQGKGHQRMVRIVQECLVWLLGVGLGLLVGSMTIAARG
jgi:hypothetical protein